MRNLCFPTINRIRLAHFSLYTLKDPIEFSFDKGIICLAGANGLGKSTFLQVINYGLTGVVPKPNQKFVSVDDYYRDILSFTEDYFHGRILPEHQDIAEVELELSFGTTHVKLRRGFVESDALRSLVVNDGNNEKDYADSSPEQRQKVFEELVVNKVGLNSFKEFVFVQAFVFTFDERRYLLFWDPKVLETCLLIFVGVEKSQRAEAERLRREMEKAESRVRNLVYDIKQAKDRLIELESTLKGKKSSKNNTKTYEEFEALTERAKKAGENVASIQAKILDAKLAIADSAARASVLRNDYKTEFEARLSSKRSARHHPVVKASLLEGVCAVCGADGKHVTATLNAALAAGECPLCGSKESAGRENPKIISRLKELDKLLSAEKKLLDSKGILISQLEESLARRVSEHHALEKELKEFEEKHRDIVSRSSVGLGDFTKIKAIYEQNITNLAKERDGQRDLSRKKTDEYRQAQKQLEQQYLEVRDHFVPIFNDLAKLFLGVDLDITMENREKSVTLVLEVKKAKRRADYQLSESQRFFIDIALRMAFARFASPKETKASLYIDTPEGSLDLAYEAQAGKMIAKFATEGHQVFMTANINTSQLLHSIATNSRACGLGLQRLYQWTELSEVQENQERNFRKTLNKIERLAKPRGK